MEREEAISEARQKVRKVVSFPTIIKKKEKEMKKKKNENQNQFSKSLLGTPG